MMSPLIIHVAVFLYFYCSRWSKYLPQYFFFLWGERGLRVAENRVLRKMCGPKKDEVTREW
jgi:hypothetical protein